MPVRAGRVLMALLAAAALAGCDGEACEFRERCDGDVRETCVTLNDGPSMIAKRCEAPNAACILVREDRAVCGMSPEQACGADFQSRCEGDLRVYCSLEGVVASVSCAALETSGCRVDSSMGGAICE